MPAPIQRTIRQTRKIEEIPKQNRFAFLSKKNTMIGLGVVAGVAVLVALYSSYELRKIKSPEYNQKLVQAQTQKITDEVGALIELPSGTPQIATVTNVDVLKQTQPFFAKAKNDDVLLIYATQAILYRPSIHKIIDVAPVNNQTSPTAPTPPASIPAPAREVSSTPE